MLKVIAWILVAFYALNNFLLAYQSAHPRLVKIPDPATRALSWMLWFVLFAAQYWAAYYLFQLRG